MKEQPPPLSGPLQIDCLRLPGGAAIGMCHCPGRTGIDGRGRTWQRDVAEDVDAIRRAGFTLVLSLLGDLELDALGAASLEARLRDGGLQWRQFPILDFGVPDGQAVQAWQSLQVELLERLAAGEQVLVHCAAGLGRTGTMVAVLLKALGHDAASAVAMVRAARPGTIETEAQQAYVANIDLRSPDSTDR